MEADFSGWATKAGLKCTDGRTIMPNAFQHQDQMRVPLVWQHGHNDPENVLGHAILENRPDGVYAYGFFNESTKADHAKGLVEHKDINMLSIWANQLIERGGRVIHGAIREVSLVLAGANPGAVIEHVTIRHSEDDIETVEDEAIIYTGIELELEHSDEGSDSETHSSTTVVDDEDEGAASHADTGSVTNAQDLTVADVFDTLTDQQKEVVYFMIGEALDSAAHSDIDSNDTNAGSGTQEGNNTMAHNVFDQSGASDKHVLSHDEMKGIVSDATKNGSLKDAVDNYALSHGIENIDVLFPDAQALDSMPEFLSRRNEWVVKVLNGTRKSPFSRIKTLSADITADEARARGYIKGNLKKEEFFSVSKRVTTPTTVYKKQKLDRDDMVDITDFDVVMWLKGEMRIMLDEEIARAILIGDGRDIASDDKINEQNVRPIATDHELFTSTVTVNIDDANSSVQEIIDGIVMNRHMFKGTGLPTFFTTESYISKFMLLKDTTGRRIYRSLDELAQELRCSEVVPVEVMEEDPTTVGILVNPVDYVVGADKGGNVSLFDDFDIDYNQYKYLIETRISGALVKLKSAIVVKKTAGSNVLVSPNEPTFNTTTGVLTIVNQTGVVYKNGATVVNAAGSPYAAIASGASITIDATPASGYYFATSDNDSWTFTRD